MTDRTPLTVITIPQPTANGPLHVGHLAGPYIAADIAARAGRARGERVLALAGVDIHQNYVLTMAQNRGEDVAGLIHRNRVEIAASFRLGRIGYDAYVDPQRRDYRSAIVEILGEMVDSGAAPVRPYPMLACTDCGRTAHHSYVTGTCSRCGSGASGGGCEGCGGFTSGENLVDPVCARCGGRPEVRVTDLPVLVMEDHREALTRAWLSASMPGRVRSLIARGLAEGLPEVPLAYPTDWGLECTGPLSGMRADVYAEVGISYFWGVAHALRPDAGDLDGYRAAWRAQDTLMWNFHGIDNAFFYGMFCPALLCALGLGDPLPFGGLVVNEFYTLDGAKFSTSRDHAIWANELLGAEDPELVRLYLAWDRPDRYGSDFTMPAFRDFATRVAPLLAKARTPDQGDPVAQAAARLAPVEVTRGIQALRPEGFDAALAARCLITALENGHDGGDLRDALTGGSPDGIRPLRRPADGEPDLDRHRPAAAHTATSGQPVAAE